jgi:hypothetical protein
MEPKFQTSFIPKKPVAQSGSAVISKPSHKGMSSVFMSVAVFLFIASLLALGGAFLWKQYLTQAQVDEKKQLADREKAFDTNLIETLKAENVKIDSSRKVLQGHIASSAIFDIIGRLTSEHVRFLSFDFTAPASAKDGMKISLQGYGSNLPAVAFQSDVLGSLEQYGLRKIVKNPVLTEPSFDTTGNVSFGFSATVDPSALNYESVLKASSVAAPAAPSSDSQ